MGDVGSEKAQKVQCARPDLAFLVACFSLRKAIGVITEAKQKMEALQTHSAQSFLL